MSPLPCKGAECTSPLFSGLFCPHLSMFAFPDALWLWKQTEEEKRPVFYSPGMQRHRESGRVTKKAPYKASLLSHYTHNVHLFVAIYCNFQLNLFLGCFAWWPSFVGSRVCSFSREIVGAILGTFPHYSPLLSGGICLSILVCWFWSQGLLIKG